MTLRRQPTQGKAGGDAELRIRSKGCDVAVQGSSRAIELHEGSPQRDLGSRNALQPDRIDVGRCCERSRDVGQGLGDSASVGRTSSLGELLRAGPSSI